LDLFGRDFGIVLFRAASSVGIATTPRAKAHAAAETAGIYRFRADPEYPATHRSRATLVLMLAALIGVSLTRQCPSIGAPKFVDRRVGPSTRAVAARGDSATLPATARINATSNPP